MEPRILLSAESLASEVYGAFLQNEALGSVGQIAIVQEIDGANAQGETDPVITLSGWHEETGDSTAVEVVEEASAIPPVESGDDVVSQPPVSDQAVAAATNDSERSDSNVESPMPDADLADVAASISSDPQWLRGPPVDDASPRAPPDYLQSTGPNDTPSTTLLTDAELAPIITAAISRWMDSELVPFAADLGSIAFTIGDLAAGTLAQYLSGTITIDETADGFGWFIDSTPDSDTEFTSPPAADAAHDIDLFTVVAHELGHALGFAHPGVSGLQGVEVMAGTLGEGVRRVPQLLDGAKLNDVLDVILATFDPASPPVGPIAFTSVTPLQLPNVATVGETPAGTPDLQLEGLKLTFSELDHSGTDWAGEVLVQSQLGVLMPGKLDIVILDDDFGSPMRVDTASSPVVVSGGWSVTFTVAGLHLGIGAGDQIGVANSNEPGFDDLDLSDSEGITVSSSSYDLLSNTTTITVTYNFDPGSAAWTGGSVLFVKTPDVGNDVDLDAVSGTLQLAPGDNTSVLNLESLDQADLGWPRFLTIRITDLKLEFNDFRVDDSDSHLRMDAAFRGLETGNAVTNQLVKSFLNVEGAANGLIFDMDRLAAGSRTAGGAVVFTQLPIIDLSGVSGLISGGIPGVGKIAAGFILKRVGIDENGNATTNTNETQREIGYLAVKGVLEVGGTTPAGPPEKDGTPPAKVGAYGFGLNLAISELGPLQLFVYVNVPIMLDPVSGLAISSLRGGVRFNSTLEDLQVRPPYTATGGAAVASGDLALPVLITLTLPGHNLKPGDEFRITAAGDPDLLNSSPENFVVLSVDGDNITYKTGGSGSESDPNNYSFGGTIEVKKISISDPFDLRDPGFQSTKDLTLEQWEAQLDQQVVNQANAGQSVWDVLFDKFVIEAGATLSFAPRIPEFVIRLDVDVLFDTELHFMFTGQMVLLTAIKFPVKYFGDFSDAGNGALTLLALVEIPQIPPNALGIQPLIVEYGEITLETLINGEPASLDALTGFPAGIGADVTAATVTDVSGTGAGPWEVTFTLDSGMDATSLFDIGDSIVVVGSQPDSFNGTYLVTGVTPTTVSFVVGTVLLDGLVDVNRSGVVDASDNGILAGIPIIAGRLDINKDETTDAEDDGEIFNVVRDAAGRRQVVSYAVIDGYVDVDGDGLADGTDGDDDAVVGEDPRLWDHGFDLTRNVVDGQFDTDGDGDADADDIASLGDLRVIGGGLDLDRSGTIDTNDDGIILNVVIDAAGNRVVQSYGVINGQIDIDGNGAIDASDDLSLNTASDLGGYWIRPAFKVANQDDLGNGLRMGLAGGLDLNIPFVTTLSLSGSATLDLTFGGASDVRLDLEVDMALRETHVGDIGHANGEFTVTMDVSGGPVVEGIPTPLVEIWGAAVLTSDFSFLNGIGIFADVSGVLVLNTTAADKDPILLQTTDGEISIIPTAETAALRLDGTLDFRIDFDGDGAYPTSEQVFQLDGTFVMSFTGADGFNVALFSEPMPGVVGPAILRIGPASAPFLEFTAFGFLAIRGNGVAANIVVGLDASLLGPFSDFATASGQFVFMVNTTGEDISFAIPAGLDNRSAGSTLSVLIPRAPPSSIADASLDVFSLITGNAWDVPAGAPGAAYVLILLGGMDAVTSPDASVVVGNVFDLRGKFSFLLRVDASFNVFVDMQFDAKMELQPLNGLLAVSGSLKINDAGVVGSLALGGELILDPLTIVGAFTLEVNTTDDLQVVQLYEFDFATEQFKRNGAGEVVLQPVSIAPHTISLFAFAKFKLTGSFVLQGSVVFVNNPDLLLLDVEMTMDFFGSELSVDGGARIVKTGPSPGFVLRLSATLNASVFGVSGIFDVDADLELRINSRPLGALDANDLEIARQTYRVEVLNASLTLLSVVSLRGAGFVEVTQGVFRMQAALSGSFLSIFSVSASAFFSSEGEFSITLNGSVTLGVDGFNISGSAHLGVSLLDSNGTLPFGSGNKVLNVSGSLTVTGELFYIPLPQVTIAVSYNSSTGAITVRAGPVPVPGVGWTTVLGVRVPYPTITLKYFTFTIGTLKLGPPPPSAVLGQVTNGELAVNVGPDAGARNLQEDEIDESVFIEVVGAGTLTGQKIKVTMFGTTQEFDNVTSVLISDMGDGADILQIAAAVSIPIEVHFGDGADTLTNLGSAQVIAYGDAGDDLLVGGSGNDQLFGGDGLDTLQAFQGDDQVSGGADSDLLVWDVGDGSDSAIDGGDDDDTVSIRGTDASESVSITSSGTGFTINIGGEMLIVGGVEVADIEGRGGSDTFTVNDSSASSLKAVNVQFGSDNDPDSLLVNGSGSAEVFDVAAAVAALTSTESDGTVVVTDVDVLQFVKTMSVTVNVFGATASGGDLVTLNTLSGDDIVNVQSILAGAATTIDGGIDSDTFNVGGTGGTLNGVAATLTINGNEPSSGSDVLNIDDSGDTLGNTGAMTSTTITGLNLAPGGVVYNGIEHLNIALGSGGDTFTIESTAPGTETTVNANDGADILNIRTIAGTTAVNGGNDSDTFNVGSLAPAAGGTVDGIGALLTVHGNAPDSGSDVLNVDDSGATADSTGTLTSTTITGLGMSPAGIVYTGIEHLIISIGSGDDSFTVNSTAAGSTSTLNSNDGEDTFNVRAMDGDVTVNGGADNDVINVGSDAPALPSWPTTQQGTIDGINGALTVNGDSGSNDVLNVDDSNPGNDAKAGTLTASTIRGLELEQGIDYATLETLNIWLAFGNNTFTVDGTQSGDTAINTAQGEDTVHVNDAAGQLAVNGEAGADTLNVNGTGAGSVVVLNGGENDDVFNIGGMDGRVHVSGDTGNDTVNVADTGQNLDQIQGPLILEGGAIADSGTIDTLNVFHTNNDDADTGHLLYRTMGAGGTILNPGLALTGFGMAEDSGGYGGGITYNGFEIVEVRLGSGDETLTVDDTGDRDEKAAIEDDPAVITAIHGGGGDDTIIVTNRGNGPLVVYGDAGNDAIDASATTAKSDPFVGVVGDGGPGNDILNGTEDDDQLAGGSGSDTINGEAGNDHIYGDSQFSVDLQLFAQDQQQRFDTETELNSINGMFTVLTTGEGYADILDGGSGNDVIFGDHGIIRQIDGTRRIESTGSMILLQTDNLASGSGDAIHGGAHNDFLFGGAGDDALYGDSGSDLIFGDHGSVGGDVDASAIGQIDGAGVLNADAVFIYTSDTSMEADASAGDDTIYGGSLAVLDTDSGKNILLGQQGSDTIYGGGSDDDIYGGHNVADGSDAGDFIDGAAGNDVILGDNGLIEHTALATDPRFTVLTAARIYDSSGNPLVADGSLIGANPAGVEARRIELFDHDDSAANAGNFGEDTIAGGADDDVIFGQLGDDTLHGDGMLVNGALATLGVTIDGADPGGDDYIEGNGGDDTAYGGLGQDDIVGGSSNIYGLVDPAMRPDGSDTLFGGNGDRTTRDDDGEGGHARDSDAIAGDNGNIFRLVGTDGTDGASMLTFHYDNYGGVRIVVRAVQLLDYTAGGLDYSSGAASDIGGGDQIHGESGDDFIYGEKGGDILFGDAQDDDIIAGYGNDWISGGAGDDGVIGDDGRIFTSRNGTAEPLYGVMATSEAFISTPGDFQQATTNVTGQLKKAVDLTPFSQDPNWGSTSDEFNGVSRHTSDDILYGGLGNDWLHGGSGDDAISGAEALPAPYGAPSNPGNVLGYSPASGAFTAYDEFAPMSAIENFLLNFAEGDGPEVVSSLGTVHTDGDDKIFGDLGNDWLVGGTGQDDLYGGWGDDLINADDDQTTNGGLNDQPDMHPAYEDRAFGGAGRDILIANTEGDRLIDWAGQFNSYIVPFAQSGMGTISRTLQPQLAEFLYALSLSDGADFTRAQDTAGDPARNGEPLGELGVIRPQDFAWQDQTGAEPEVLLGVIPQGKREVLRSASFDGPQSTTAGGFSTADGFSPDSGIWRVESGALQVSANSPAGDAVSVFEVGDVLPGYFEVLASVLAIKPTGGWNANSFIIFDYQGEKDFKFAGIDVSTNKLVMGHRDAGGWKIDEQGSVKGGLKSDTPYNLLLAVNGVNATLVVDNEMVFTHTYQPRVVEGYSYGLNWGLVGVGSNNARGVFDNIQIQILPPQLTFDETEDFEGAETLSFSGYTSGLWSVASGAYSSTSSGTTNLSILDLGPDNLAYSSYLELSATVNTTGRSGFVFDRYEDGSFKFAVIDATTGEAIIGHYTTKKGWVYDAVVSAGIKAGTSYTVGVVLKGTTVSLTLDGQTLLGYSFNASVVDGGFGLLTTGGTATFDNVRVKTNDFAFQVD